MASSTAPSRKLSDLPLRPSTLSMLERRGFVSTGELEESKRNGGMSNLAAELGCSLAEASGILQEVNGCAIPKESTTALSLISKLSSKNQQRTIVTFSRSIDELLGGGVAKSEVTEIVALPGMGKTQLAMQLCVNARLPLTCGGVAGESVYIDTEGSFSPERCFTMAKALVDHVQVMSKRRKSSKPDWFTAETILDGIHVYRVHDEAAQTATIYSLPSFLKQRADSGTPVRLLIIDSIAFHYRCAPAGSDYIARTKSLNMTAAFLADLAAQFDVAVVVINQMTTKMGATSKLVPALGESWGHAMTTRILLSGSEHETTRKCTLVKSPHKAAGTALFQVKETGIRDAPKSSDASKRQRVQ